MIQHFTGLTTRFDKNNSVKRRTICSKFRRDNKKNYCFESVKSVKRMLIRSHDNRLFRIVSVKSGCKPRNLFQEYSTLDSHDLSPGRTQLDTNRTNRTRTSGGKYESARFWGPALNW